MINYNIYFNAKICCFDKIKEFSLLQKKKEFRGGKECASEGTCGKEGFDLWEGGEGIQFDWLRFLR